MWLPLLLACVPPTTIGIRSDGTVGPAGSTELSLSGGAGWGTGTALQEILTGFGGTAAYSVTDRVAAVGSVARIDDANALELGARTRISPDEAGWTLTTLEDLSLLGGALGEGEPVLGLRAGGVCSYGGEGPWRPYAGLVVNPSWVGDSLWWYSDLGVGVSLRAKSSERVQTRLLGELSWSYDWTDRYSTVVAVVSAGVAIR